MRSCKLFSRGMLILALFLLPSSCTFNGKKYINPDAKVVFLHHSTGLGVFKGEVRGLAKLTKRIGPSLVTDVFKEYNKEHKTKYAIKAKRYPGGNLSPYPWENYPYDFYNIWVKNGDEKKYMSESTLKVLTKKYDVIVLKHCFPVSKVLEDDKTPDINSSKKTIANYTLQYQALKAKMLEHPDNKFIVWTGAALLESQTTPEQAERAKQFFDWVVNEWDDPDDNIFIFDFRKIETNGGLYLLSEYASGSNNAHPNQTLSELAGRAFAERVIDVIENY